jgi:hypothetical protein
MKQTIWFMWKPGEKRTFVSTNPPSPEWAEIQRKDGFYMVSFDLELPDPADISMGTLARVVPRSLVDPIGPFLVETATS